VPELAAEHGSTARTARKMKYKRGYINGCLYGSLRSFQQALANQMVELGDAGYGSQRSFKAALAAQMVEPKRQRGRR
jgi:hypothetical protein